MQCPDESVHSANPISLSFSTGGEQEAPRHVPNSVSRAWQHSPLISAPELIHLGMFAPVLPPVFFFCLYPILRSNADIQCSVCPMTLPLTELVAPLPLSLNVTNFSLDFF